MNYVAYTLIPRVKQGLSAEETSDMLLAELQDLPFESFEQIENGLIGYIQQELDNQELYHQLLHHSQIAKVSREIIPHQNWNEAWESAFQPVEINKQVRVRALFHPPDPSFAYELVIQPKMSFGTGHHATTRLILEELVVQPPVGLKVLDMGCGTSVLGILAEKLGAAKVDAVDVDSQCVENSIENISLNQCSQVSVFLLDEFKLDRTYELIIANIQRNVLLEQMPLYDRLSDNGTHLWLSGIMEHDKDVVIKYAEEYNFRFIKEKILAPWVLLILKKMV
ncbi:MAG: 50S ribosomal protein L11 methyltransferase [Flavobacteriales bacterium]|nr:50S ribosomal protein L11 methyltransferase [Flavobacteriales bacterium]